MGRAFRLYVLAGLLCFSSDCRQGKRGRAAQGATWIGAREGRGLYGRAMGGDMGQGGVARVLYGLGGVYAAGAARLAFTSKLCNCVIYDRLPQNSAATSFRYLFGVKCCYFVF
jgi:hypothetical protein